MKKYFNKLKLRLKNYLDYLNEKRAIKKSISRANSGMVYATDLENFRTYSYWHTKHEKDLERLKKEYHANN